MRRSGVRVALVALLFTVGAPFFGDAQPTSGDWVVTGVESVSDRAITLAGNLTIKAGGSLTLDRVTLQVSVHSNGERGIFVEPGGALVVRNSTIESADATRLRFVAEGDRFVVEDSTLRDIGWCTETRPCGVGAYDGSQGLLVRTRGAVFRANNVSNAGIGIILWASDGRIEGNTFRDSNFYSVLVTGLDNAELRYTANASIRGNAFFQTGNFDSQMVTLNMVGRTRVENNTFLGLPHAQGRAVFFLGDSFGWRNEIRGNRGTATAGIMLQGRTSGAIIEDNDFTYCEQGISAWSAGSRNVIRNNTFRQDDHAKYEGYFCGAGFDAKGLRETVVEGNHFTTVDGGGLGGRVGGTAMILSETFDSTIVNNLFEGVPVPGQPSLYMLKARGNRIAGNEFAATTGTGLATVVLFASDENDLNNNSFHGNHRHGLALMASSRNLVMHNDFLAGGLHDQGDGNHVVANHWAGSAPGDVAPSPEPGGVRRVEAPPPPAPPARLLLGPRVDEQVPDERVYQGAVHLPAGNIQVLAGGRLVFRKADALLGDGESPGEPFPLLIHVQDGAELVFEQSNVTWGVGSIAVDAGGSATFVDSRFHVVGPETPSLGAVGKGIFRLENTTFQTAPGGGGFSFRGEEGARIFIDRSHLNGGSNTGDHSGTIRVTGHPGTIHIRNSTVENSPIAITIFVGSPPEVFRDHHLQLVVEDSIIRNVSNVVESSGVEEFRFHRNTVQNHWGGVLAQARNLSIQDNVISDGWGGLAIDCRAEMARVFACVDVAPVRGNRLRDVGGGGIFATADGIVIENNTLERAGFGLYVVGDGLVVRQNTLIDSANLDLHGKGSTVYLNNLINSSATDQTGDNAWSHGGIGNYWSNYEGQDDDGDSIGDTPHLVLGALTATQDPHPLMYPAGSLPGPPRSLPANDSTQDVEAPMTGNQNDNGRRDDAIPPADQVPPATTPGLSAVGLVAVAAAIVWTKRRRER